MKRAVMSVVVLGVAGLAAAAPGGPPSAQSGGKPSARIATWFPGGRGPVDLGPVPAGLSDTDADTCMGCHIEIGAEWRASMHRQSYSGEIFQAGYRMDRLDFCRNCHAPLWPEDSEPEGEAAAHGISCSVCHVREGRVLATRVSAAGQRAHAMRKALVLGQSEFCAGCHEFRFPGREQVARPAFDPGEHMQKTFSEWRGSEAGARGTLCQDCHMAWTGRGGERHRSHAFPGAGSRAFMARAIKVGARVEQRGAISLVRVDVDTSGVGHAFPSGDMYRQAVVRVWPRGREDLAKRVILARQFGAGTVRIAGKIRVLQRETRDTRPGARAQGPIHTYVFRFAGVSGAAFEYRVEHMRMSESLARRQKLRADQVRTIIHQGVASASNQPQRSPASQE